jgi:signal transduction histidine kinase
MGDMMGIVAPAFIALIVTAGVILGTSGILATAAISFVLWLAAAIIAGTGAIPPAPLPRWLTDAVLFGTIVVCLIWTAILNHGATSRMRRLLTEANYHLIEANRQLQEANSLKSRFVARVSHDLRTPLSSILLSAGIIRRNLYGPLTPKQEEVLDRILNSTKHLESIINDILDISKLEAGQLDLVEEAFEVDSLVKAVQATVEQTARDKGLAFPISLAPGMPARILGDRRRLIQILINLADNAVKFTSQGEVSTLIEPMEDDRWRMVVRDTGRGIHEEDLEVIFEEFRQADRAPTSAGGGAGLGLAITRHLVELMEGEIHVKSKLGKGSTFQVILPLKMPNQLPGQKETIHPSPSRPKRS